MTLLHSDTSPELRRVFTIWVAALWLARLALEPLVDLAGLPPEMFRPVGPVGWLPRRFELYFLEPAVLRVLWWSSFGAMALTVLRPRQPFALLVAAVTLTAHQSIVRSLGHMNHAEMVLLYAVYALAFVAALEWWTKAASPPLDAFPLVMTATALCLTYCLTAIYRLANGGLAVFTSGSVVGWSVAALYNPIEWPPPWGLLAGSDLVRWCLTASLPLITLIELTAPLCLVSARFRLFLVPGLAALHAGTWLFMGILFVEHVALLPFLTRLPQRLLDPRPAAGAPPVIYFDGACGLCNRFVDYMLARDRLAIFRFAPLQSRFAADRLGPAALEEDSIALVDETGTHRRSDAVLRAVARLGGVHAAARLLWLIPRALRDAVYDLVAAHRYRIFGRLESCRLPSPDERDRFMVELDLGSMTGRGPRATGPL